MHVLVIDDDQVILNMISMLLRFEKIETTTVDNLQLAYRLINEINPDVICCDLMMPDGGGIKLLEEKRNVSNGHDAIPVVVITGSNSPKMLQEAEMLGIHTIIPKPFSSKQLIAAIKSATVAPVA